MKKRFRNLLIIIIIIGIITAILLPINNFIILTKIYSRITYKANVQNSESIIEKSELFNYDKYCKYREGSEEVYNLNNSYRYYYINSNLIETYKSRVENDDKKFHFFPFHFYGFYWHKLIYSLEVSNLSLIYLTYSNISIFKAEYANHTEIFEAFYSEINPILYEGSWYLNFTLIPFASNISSTITLNNIFLVKMSLEYDYFFRWFLFGMTSELLTIEQYLCFDSNFQLLFVYFPLEGKSQYI